MRFLIYLTAALLVTGCATKRNHSISSTQQVATSPSPNSLTAFKMCMTELKEMGDPVFSEIKNRMKDSAVEERLITGSKNVLAKMRRCHQLELIAINEITPPAKLSASISKSEERFISLEAKANAQIKELEDAAALNGLVRVPPSKAFALKTETPKAQEPVDYKKRADQCMSELRTTVTSLADQVKKDPSRENTSLIPVLKRFRDSISQCNEYVDKAPTLGNPTVSKLTTAQDFIQEEINMYESFRRAREEGKRRKEAPVQSLGNFFKSLGKELVKSDSDRIRDSVTIQCLERGYEEGTALFANCSKLLTDNATADLNRQRAANAAIWSNLMNESSDVMTEYGRNRATINSTRSFPSSPTTACYKTNEQISGMYKTCAYQCSGGEAFRTISASDLCPSRPLN